MRASRVLVALLLCAGCLAVVAPEPAGAATPPGCNLVIKPEYRCGCSLTPVSGPGEKAPHVPLGQQSIVYVRGYLANISVLSGALNRAKMQPQRALARL